MPSSWNTRLRSAVSGVNVTVVPWSIRYASRVFPPRMYEATGLPQLFGTFTPCRALTDDTSMTISRPVSARSRGPVTAWVLSRMSRVLASLS